jgi:gamma-glutamyl phosphate reductase
VDPTETEEETLRIMRGTIMAWENAVLSENEDDIEKARQRSVLWLVM